MGKKCLSHMHRTELLGHTEYSGTTVLEKENLPSLKYALILRTHNIYCKTNKG